MAICSISSIQNINDRRFWIWKNKCIIEFNKVPKDVKLNSIHFFIMKTHNRELHQIAINHLSNIDFKDFIKINKNVLQNHILF